MAPFPFLGAFTDTPLNKIHDVFEVPPFGQLGDREYSLTPERVNCVFVSNYLATAVGHATNVKIRYDNYIQPFVELLVKMGASS